MRTYGEIYSAAKSGKPTNSCLFCRKRVAKQARSAFVTVAVGDVPNVYRVHTECLELQTIKATVMLGRATRTIEASQNL